MYPDPKARRAADEAIDALDWSVPMGEYVKIWESAYFDAGGRPGL